MKFAYSLNVVAASTSGDFYFFRRPEIPITIIGPNWKAPVRFFDFPSAAVEAVVLGHAGFLDFFTATFDSQLAELTLVANDELPATE